MTSRCGVCGAPDVAPEGVLCERCAEAYVNDLDELVSLCEGEDESPDVLSGLQAHCAIIHTTRGDLDEDDGVPGTVDECATDLRAQHEWLVNNPQWAPALTMNMRDLRDRMVSGR